MRRGLTIMVMLAIGAVSIGLYQIELEVRGLKRELSDLNRGLEAEQHAIRVLQAEWNFLNRPDRLQELTGEHLSMVPSIASQVASVEEIPFRIDEGRALVSDPQGGSPATESWPGNGEKLPLPAFKPRRRDRHVILASHEAAHD